MLYSLALILIIGFILSGIFNKLKLPSFLGMIFTGVILGPYVLNLISPDILNVSTDLREIALVVILTRAGLSLDLKDLKKVGRPAILLCFVPALLEIIGIIIFAPLLLNISYLEAAILGTVLAAVSPAVVVPKMLKLMDKGYGKDKPIPQLIMAGASVDDVFVIVLFTSFMSMYKGDGFHIVSLISAPIAILSGIFLGVLVGGTLNKIFMKMSIRDTVKVLIMLAIAFLLVTIENKVDIPFSGLLAVMFMGITLLKCNENLANRLSHRFSKIWVLAEVLLFVLVGAAVDFRYLFMAGIMALVLIAVELCFRVMGVYISLHKTSFTPKEKVFCSIAYLPKATVQAAIGAVPLAAGVTSGNLILAIAVLVILITAPLGAVGMELSYKALLQKSM